VHESHINMRLWLSAALTILAWTPMQTPSTSVVIVEHNSGLRESLTYLFRQTPGYALVGAFSACDQFLDQLAARRLLPPQLVLLGAELSGRSSLEDVRMTKERLPDAHVLLMAVFEDDEAIFHLICAGASGYSLKKTAPSGILEVMREVSHGGARMTPPLARKVIKVFPPCELENGSKDLFSAFERNLLAGLGKGMSPKMIAKENSINPEIGAYTKNFT
jgi:DNA-binding NarL/FixJ family response regulator